MTDSERTVGGGPPRTGLRDRALRCLVGPRFIDLPTRALTFIVAASGIFWGVLESDDLAYVTLYYVSQILVLVVAFIPLSGSVLCVVLGALLCIRYPDFLNNFDFPIYVAAAVMLSRGRWRSWLGLSLLAMGFDFGMHALSPNSPVDFGYVAYTAVLTSALGISGFLIERRLNRELSTRARDAREYEQRVQNERIDLAINAHDTISQGLATEAAIIRLLSAQATEEERIPMLTELSLVNADTKQQLSHLLARLTGPVTGPTGGSGALYQGLDALRAAAETGRIELRLEHSAELERLPIETINDMLLAMRELVTNMVKHAARDQPCELKVFVEGCEPAELVLASRNYALDTAGHPPRSLSLRAKRLGGSCTAGVEDGIYSVEFRLPLPCSIPPD
ncbi:hypothetical protein ET475_10730 [Microbacterium protaetiae]|uniref:Signal transduction histidine kinase subgroup 3 dimerisation and phosphoacceptor domain-containing protein n=1 Tax=Microbacterium protaetiae TaxID=2509458 RepID=A0A4P6EDR8_9MICO|nr:hypothetical protein [Microbacterium protaetiae]QAY60415.1 hypothetical protein ET475_10730 [Microbacterium protaetiae]